LEHAEAPRLSSHFLLWAPLLAGCPVAGGYIGAQRDPEIYLGRGLAIGAAIDIGVIAIGSAIAYIVITELRPNY
jgi:hypothetical protein